MSEKPDCGEFSYKGSGRLANRSAVLTGADSGIGRVAAIAFAREGADVAIGYLPQEQEDGAPTSHMSQSEVAQFRDSIRLFGPRRRSVAGWHRPSPASATVKQHHGET
jgi:NAD(P)-dependent dehydrogenase (short-subunit alcohol dehydrogenase family)